MWGISKPLDKKYLDFHRIQTGEEKQVVNGHRRHVILDAGIV